MQSLAESFLTPDEQRRVTECVQQAERRTSGEIVPMVVSASYDYPMATVRGATVISLPLALIATEVISALLWLQVDKMWLFLGCFAILYLGAYFLVGRLPSLKRRFLSPARIEEEVKEAATTAFFTEGLYRTRAENGIILFISVFERRVWILGDRGINEKISPETWQDIVDQVTNGVKSGHSCDAICAAIEAIGDILEEHFPIESDDKDELHNLIIR